MSNLKVAELFAGVGGFRIGLDAAGGFETVWANQWEPNGTPAKQFAFRCYEEHFGEGSCINRDIHEVIKEAEEGTITIPDIDLVCGGFPCQDYSVAKPLSDAKGIEGKKGILWWDIYRFLKLKEPQYCVFENVDRLLKSPAAQRGRDFAIILACMMNLGYGIEWRVVNSAEYGFPQRRKRIFIYAEKVESKDDFDWFEHLHSGIMATAFPCRTIGEIDEIHIPDEPYTITKSWDAYKTSPFREAGIAIDGIAYTYHIDEVYEGERRTLGDVIVPASQVPREFWIDDSQLEKWRYLKGAKREKRTASNGHEYWYSEGSMAFPDLLSNPSRTILTGEGGNGASRFKHIIEQDGKHRRLIPEELEALQGFPRGWTNGMADTKRAFCMGNALVVGVVTSIGRAINQRRERLGHCDT